jgi:hypothetical protein
VSENVSIALGLLLAMCMAVAISVVSTEGPSFAAQMAPYFSLIDRECEDSQQQYYAAKEGAGAYKNKYPAEQEQGRGDAHEHADVCAQNVMAKAAAKGLWALGFTLFFTGSAAVFAGLTWRTMRQTAERELRAYVSIFPRTLYNFAAGTIRIDCEATNHGATPAFQANHVFCIAVFENPLPATFIFPPADRPVTNNAAVFPRNSIKVWFNHTRALTPAEVAAIEAGTHNLYLWGSTTYRDAFGVARTTNFNVSLDLPTFIHSRNEMRAGRADPGFSWEYRDQHNQAT